MNYTCQKCGGPMPADLTKECPMCFPPPPSRANVELVAAIRAARAKQADVDFCVFDRFLSRWQPEMPDQNPQPENGRGEQAGRLQKPAEDAGD